MTFTPPPNRNASLQTRGLLHLGSGRACLALRSAAAIVPLALACASGLAQARKPLPEQYPKPLIHTPTDHPAARIILINVHGLHAVDLANWVAIHPHSALADLAAHGVTYTNAHTPWADPAAGLLALVTGGTPISTGILSDDSYDRTLSPPGSACKTTGTPLSFASILTASGRIDPEKLPLDPAAGCAPLAPHAWLRVNNIFEVAHEKVGRTAWAGDSAAITDLLRGPSGQGLDEDCVSPSGKLTKDQAGSDIARTNAILNLIDGKDCTATHTAAVPALFGMDFAAIANAQRHPAMGYLAHGELLSTGLESSFALLDTSVARIVVALKTRQLYPSTWIVLCAASGQSPMDSQAHRLVPLARVEAAAGAGTVAHITGGNAALLWLKDPAATAAVVRSLHARAAFIGVASMYSGQRLALTLNLTASDPRMPDIVLEAQPGVLWSSPTDKALASSGGLSDEDTHVALLVSGVQLNGRLDKTLVPTTQLAPLLLRALGMEKFDLDALHPEHTPALPGIF